MHENKAARIWPDDRTDYQVSGHTGAIRFQLFPPHLAFLSGTALGSSSCSSICALIRGGYLNLGLVYQRTGKYAKAVENWDKAIQITPGNSLANYYRGTALQGLQRKAEAAANFKRCLAQNPDPGTGARAEERLRTVGAI
jgi:tetratricopeptide (TPR) repeat protein